MSLLNSTIMHEKKRIEYMIDQYRKVKKELPKGTLCPKQMGNQTYYYLKYRNGDKIVSDYVPRENLDWLTEQIEHRKHIDMMIKSLKAELETAKKISKTRKKS